MPTYPNRKPLLEPRNKRFKVRVYKDVPLPNEPAYAMFNISDKRVAREYCEMYSDSHIEITDEHGKLVGVKLKTLPGINWKDYKD